MNNERVRYILLVVIIYATMFLFGYAENLKAVSFPLIKAEFGISYDEQGGLVSVISFGYVLFCAFAGLFLSRFGIKKSILAGYLLICLGAGAVLFAPTVIFVSASLFVVYAGFGFFEVGSNALATVTFTKKAALMLNFMHFFYGLGAVAAPRAAGFLGESGFSWQQVYLSAAIPSAVFFIFVLLFRFNGAKTADQPKQARYTYISALRDGDVWHFAVMLGFMVLVELAAANWGALYLNDVYSLDPLREGATFVSVFYVLFTLSRLFSGFGIEKIGYKKSLLISAIAVTAIFAAGFGMGRAGIWLLTLTGFCVGMMWPTVIAAAMEHFGDRAPIATGAIIAIAGATNAVFQLVIGFTNQYIGEAWGYRSCTVYAVAVILLVLSVMKKTGKSTGVHNV